MAVFTFDLQIIHISFSKVVLKPHRLTGLLLHKAGKKNLHLLKLFYLSGDLDFVPQNVSIKKNLTLSTIYTL